MADRGNVVLDTGMGQIVVELYWDHAPKTCKNFFELAKRGLAEHSSIGSQLASDVLDCRYYTGTIFHRIIPNFMIQGGDPTATGRGGTSIYGGKFGDEITRELRFTGAGILAMANSGPDTNGSQFFITLAPTPHLDGKHTIFGRILSGMRVVERLGAVQTNAQDRPLEDIKILKSRVAEPEEEQDQEDEEATGENAVATAA